MIRVDSFIDKALRSFVSRGMNQRHVHKLPVVYLKCIPCHQLLRQAGKYQRLSDGDRDGRYDYLKQKNVVFKRSQERYSYIWWCTQSKENSLLVRFFAERSCRYVHVHVNDITKKWILLSVQCRFFTLLHVMWSVQYVHCR